MKQQRLLTAIGLTLVFLVLILLVILRAQLVDHNIGTYIACSGCFHFSVIMADLSMFSLAAVMLLLAGLLRPPWLGRGVHLLFGVLLLVYVTDLIVFKLFNSRLFMSDAALFMPEGSAIWNQFSTGMGGVAPTITLMGGVLLTLVFLALLPPVRAPSQRLLLAAVLVVSLTAGAVMEPQPYVNEWAVDNVFAANLATTERVLYSDEVAAGILALPREQSRVETVATAANRNVILVLLESWSSWHSELFGGYEDWTPGLDAAARDGLRFTNWHSIGFSTDKGLVGILAGQQIWAPFLHWFETPPFHSMWGLGQTLPAVFSQQAYHTAFLTTGPLDLYQKGVWISDLGFNYAEGNEHPFYANLPRYAFGSATDEALYARANDWRKTAPSPYLLVLETVTSHQPYTDPETGQNSLERAMKYADRTFTEFLRELEDTGFFENGVLMVVSDHRSMTPIPARELEALGPNAHSQVPAFIIGAGFRAGEVDDHVYSQSDLVPTFALWLSGTTQLDPLQAVMFGNPSRRSGMADTGRQNCAFHSRGDQRGLVEAICSGARGQIRLDGDQTRFTHSEGLSDQDRSDILADLAALRLEGLRRHEQHQTSAELPDTDE